MGFLDRVLGKKKKVDNEIIINDWLNKGKDLLNSGKYQEAVSSFEKAISLCPAMAEAWYNKNRALRELGSYGEAEKCIDKARELDPSKTVEWMNEDLASFEKKKPILAAGMWYNKGTECLNRGQQKEALIYYDKAINVNPKFFEAWYNKGNIMMKLNENKEALNCFNKSIELEPKSADAWNNKGCSLWALNQYDEAIKCLDKAIEINPNYAAAINSRGILLKLTDRKNDAKEAFSRAKEKGFGGYGQYNIRCWIETISPNHIPSMFPLEVMANVLPNGLEISVGYEYAKEMDNFSMALQIGLFHTLSNANTLDSFVISYYAMEGIMGKFYIIEGNSRKHEKTITEPYFDQIPDKQTFQIEIIYSNVAKKTKLEISIVADRNKCVEDPNQTLNMYNELIKFKNR